VEIDGITQPAPAPRFSRTPTTAGPIELPGEHSREILEAWGVPGAESLMAEGVVRGAKRNGN
jgi:alpha-methylacyl-CoA racemase